VFYSAYFEETNAYFSTILRKLEGKKIIIIHFQTCMKSNIIINNQGVQQVKSKSSTCVQEPEESFVCFQ